MALEEEGGGSRTLTGISSQYHSSTKALNTEKHKILFIKIYLTTHITPMTAMIYTGISIDSCRLHRIYKVKVKVLATMFKSKLIFLATWEFF